MTILGKFALNITNIPTEENEEKKDEEKTKPDHKAVENFAQCFFDVIRQLVPTVSYI